MDWSDQIIGDLKREGKYDEMRRNIADELTLEGIIPNLQVSIFLSSSFKKHDCHIPK